MQELHKNGGSLPLDLKAGALEGADVVPERRGSIGTAEDVLVQVETPDEVLILPSLAETGELNVHEAIILEHVVALAEEAGELADTDVLAHLKLRDLVVLDFGGIAVVHAKNAGLLFGNTSLAQNVVAPSSTVLSDSDTGNLGAVVETGKLGEGAPAGANVEHGLALLELKLLADDGHLVVLELLEGFLAGRVGDDARGVDHAGAEEPGVVVVAVVVVGADLLHVLVLGVEENVGAKGEEDELEEVPGEAEVGPVVAVLEDIENVTVGVNLAVDIHLGESLDGDLGAATPLGLVGSILEGNVRLDGAAGELGVLVDARAEGGLEGPVGDEDGEQGNEAEDELGLDTATDQAGEEPRDSNDETAQEEVGKAVVTGTFSG